MYVYTPPKYFKIQHASLGTERLLTFAPHVRIDMANVHFAAATLYANNTCSSKLKIEKTMS